MLLMCVKSGALKQLMECDKCRIHALFSNLSERTDIWHILGAGKKKNNSVLRASFKLYFLLLPDCTVEASRVVLF